jgi:DNA polymerase-3 subunit beta
MKVVCDRAALVEALALAGSVVPSRTSVPVLRSLAITAEDGVLTVAATNTEVDISIGVPQVEIQTPGKALIPSDKLNQVVRACEDSTITLETEKNYLMVRSEDAHFKLIGTDPKEFQGVKGFPEDAPSCFTCSASVLRTLIGRTLFATAVENSRYAISGVLAEKRANRLRFVATDGRRLAVALGDVKGGPENDTFIIPSKPLQILNKLVDDPDATVSIAHDDAQAIFKIGEGPDAAVLSANLVEGQFPPFEDVIPKDQDKKVCFESSELGSAVRRAALLTNEESKGVRMTFTDEKLLLSSRASGMGEAEIQVELKSYQGDPIEIGFNPAFLTEALRVVDSPEIEIELKAPNKPGVMKVGADFTYVVMPVNLT